MPSCSDELRLLPIRYFLNCQGDSHIWKICFSSIVLGGKKKITLASGVGSLTARRINHETQSE